LFNFYFADTAGTPNISWWGKNILRGRGCKRVFGEKYIEYNKINNNSENFRGQDC